MTHALVRIKPLSLAKLYAVFSGLITIIVGLIMDAFIVLMGSQGLTLTLQMYTETGQPVVQNIMFNPTEMLLFTFVVAVIVMIVSFFYGLLLALLYNVSSGIAGGVKLDLVCDECEKMYCTNCEPNIVKMGEAKKEEMKMKAKKKMGKK